MEAASISIDVSNPEKQEAGSIPIVVMNPKEAAFAPIAKEAASISIDISNPEKQEAGSIPIVVMNPKEAASVMIAIMNSDEEMESITIDEDALSTSNDQGRDSTILRVFKMLICA
jgi:hypothetical protein